MPGLYSPISHTHFVNKHMRKNIIKVLNSEKLKLLSPYHSPYHKSNIHAIK